MTDHSPKLVYWNPYVAGIALGIVLFLSFVLSGAGLGASGGIARCLAFGVDQVDQAAVDRNLYFANYAGGTNNPLDHTMVWMLLGVSVGGFVSGILAGRVRFETYKGPKVSKHLRWVLAFAGGGLMGFGAAMARGCTSGQALSGGAVLSVGSWAFMMMVFGGGYLIAYPLRRLWI
ncbi:putative inner membrane protein [Planctomycetes bacterium CA13]|uniref:Putative inner membrane protein n=1 Tax=Novipirellula herctigrandis TaxID=2527986 RepID=A0A5C5ZC64_9BACT|nr:putative inner membrane protein [Planctomycetes bacterium CA13]